MTHMTNPDKSDRIGHMRFPTGCSFRGSRLIVVESMCPADLSTQVISTLEIVLQPSDGSATPLFAFRLLSLWEFSYLTRHLLESQKCSLGGTCTECPSVHWERDVIAPGVHRSSSSRRVATQEQGTHSRFMPMSLSPVIGT